MNFVLIRELALITMSEVIDQCTARACLSLSTSWALTLVLLRISYCISGKILIQSVEIVNNVLLDVSLGWGLAEPLWPFTRVGDESTTASAANVFYCLLV